MILIIFIAQLDSKNWVGIDDVMPTRLYISYYEKVQSGWAYAKTTLVAPMI